MRWRWAGPPHSSSSSLSALEGEERCLFLKRQQPPSYMYLLSHRSAGSYRCDRDDHQQGGMWRSVKSCKRDSHLQPRSTSWRMNVALTKPVGPMAEILPYVLYLPNTRTWSKTYISKWAKDGIHPRPMTAPKDRHPAPAQITLALTRHSAHTPTVYRIATSDDVRALLPDGTKPCDEPA